MVPDLIWAPDFFGLREIWNRRSLDKIRKSHMMIFMRGPNFLAPIYLRDQTSWGPNFLWTKFLGDQKSQGPK